MQICEYEITGTMRCPQAVTPLGEEIQYKLFKEGSKVFGYENAPNPPIVAHIIVDEKWVIPLDHVRVIRVSKNGITEAVPERMAAANGQGLKMEDLPDSVKQHINKINSGTLGGNVKNKSRGGMVGALIGAGGAGGYAFYKGNNVLGWMVLGATLGFILGRIIGSKLPDEKIESESDETEETK